MSLVFASPGAVRFRAVTSDTSRPVEVFGGARTSRPVGESSRWASGVWLGSVAVSASVASSLSVLPGGVDSPWDPYWSIPSASTSAATSVAQGMMVAASADGPWSRRERPFFFGSAFMESPKGAQGMRPATPVRASFSAGLSLSAAFVRALDMRASFLSENFFSASAGVGSWFVCPCSDMFRFVEHEARARQGRERFAESPPVFQ